MDPLAPNLVVSWRSGFEYRICMRARVCVFVHVSVRASDMEGDGSLTGWLWEDGGTDWDSNGNATIWKHDGSGTEAGRWLDGGGTVAGRWQDGGGTLT